MRDLIYSIYLNTIYNKISNFIKCFAIDDYEFRSEFTILI